MKLVKKQVKPGIVVLELSGRVSMGNDCSLLDQEVTHHIQQKENRVIFDLTAVNHVDSAVVGQIVKCFTSLKRAGGTLRLAGVNGMVDGVLRMTQVHKVIEIFPTVLEASENFPVAN